MNELTPQEVMQLHDGELDPAREEQLNAAMGTSALEQLAGLEQVSAWLGAWHDEAGADYTSLSDGVIARLDDAPNPRFAASELALNDLTGADSAPIDTASPAVNDGAVRRVDESAPAAWTRWLAAGVLAAAAAVAVFMNTEPDSPTVAVADGTDSAPAPVVPAPPAPVAEAEAPIAIVKVEFGEQPGAIFMVGDEATPVVWLQDDVLPEGDSRTDPL